MDNATEWQEVLKTAAKTALILVILDMLRLSKNLDWFEVRTPDARSVLPGPDASCAAGTRRFRFHAGCTFQRRRQVLVGADTHAGPPAGAPH